MVLHASGLPSFLWGEVVRHIAWLKNRTPTKGVTEGKTLYEMLYQRKPTLKGVHEWGEKIWVHVTGNNKLQARGVPARWLGYNEETNAHRVYWPEKKTVSVERSIKFHDNQRDDVGGIELIQTEESKGEKESNPAPTLEDDNAPSDNETSTEDHSEHGPTIQDPLGDNFEGPAETEQRSQRVR